MVNISHCEFISSLSINVIPARERGCSCLAMTKDSSRINSSGYTCRISDGIAVINAKMVKKINGFERVNVFWLFLAAGGADGADASRQSR